jgi:putative flippase GtrA
VGSVEETIDSIKAGAPGLNQVDRAALAQPGDTATVVDAPKAKLNPALIAQFVKFGIVGISNTLLTLAVYTALLKGFDMWYLAASAIGYAVGMVNGFVWNSKWTFRGHAGDALTPVRWFVVQGCGLVADLGLVFLFVHNVGLDKLLGQVCTTAVVTVFTFIANRAWTFRMHPAAG